jgi:predicted MPP superfamily phosphohydrolase
MFANAIVLFLAWVGHSYWLTVLLNFVYALPLHRKFLRTDRLIIGGLVFAFPVAVGWWTGWDILATLRQWHGLGVYLWWCLLIGGLVLPLITIYRFTRRPPQPLVETTSQIVDVAQRLGRRPLGYGEHWRMARMPGNQIFQVEFSEKTLALPRLPSGLNGLTILHISDFHFHGTPEREFFEVVLDELGGRPTPDIVCMTGDYVDTKDHHRWIKPLLSRLEARHGRFAIVGNHDYWCEPEDVRKELRRAGFTVVSHECVATIIREVPVQIIGHEGPWFPAPRLHQSPTPSLLPSSPFPPFRLLLSHTPDNIGWAKRNQVDLMLSGHTHGGQVRVPVMGSMFVPSRFSRKYDQGVFFEAPTVLHVVRGLSGREPLRWNCRPEVTLLRLATQ